MHSRLSCAHSRYIICTLQVYHLFARCHALSKVTSACSRCILTLQAYHLHTPSASSFSYITKSLSADDSQLHRSCQPSDIDKTVLSVQDCISDIKDRMTDNKLQLNKDKTEAMLFNSSKLQDAITLRNTRRKVIVLSLINIFGPSVWNSLPSHIRNAAPITTFKSALKTHFFSLYHSD